MYRRTFAEINLDHLAHNFQALKAAFPQVDFLCPMVKANAYGHGDVAVARCLEKLGAKHLGVCLTEEGLLLRRYGIKTDILVFRGFDRDGAVQILKHKLTPVVSTWEQLELLAELATSPVDVHLKFNTGMNRLGFQPQEAGALYKRLSQPSQLRLKGLLTHLYNSEDAVELDGDSVEQLLAMESVADLFAPLKPVLHALNSAGILNALKVRREKNLQHPLLRRNWGLRPGLMTYGYNPLPDQSLLSLKPVMTLKSVASTFRTLEPSEVVSYGGTWKAQRPSVVAVVPIGYADGYHRILSNKAEVLFEGHRVPVVGQVCMDFLMLDVTSVVHGRDLREFKDREIILFGENPKGDFLSAAELAKHAQTITWEVLTSVGERVPRVYVGAFATQIETAGGAG